MLVEEGDTVSRGQPLARLDDTLLRAQIDQARATLAQQQVAAERAEAEAGRVDGLDNQGVLSEEAIAAAPPAGALGPRRGRAGAGPAPRPARPARPG